MEYHNKYRYKTAMYIDIVAKRNILDIPLKGTFSTGIFET